MIIDHWQFAIDELTDDFNLPSMDYVTEVTKQHAHEKLIRFLKIIKYQPVETDFRRNLRRMLIIF